MENCAGRLTKQIVPRFESSERQGVVLLVLDQLQLFLWSQGGCNPGAITQSSARK